MPDPFRASRIKISRARHHLTELIALEDGHEAFKELDIPDGSTPPGAISLGHMQVTGPPEEYGAIVGDVIHNLRSALDLMAVALVDLNGGNTRGVYFPFSINEGELDDQIRLKNFDRAGALAVKQLKEFQPYKGGNIALRAVHDLDIEDKHKQLIPIQTHIIGRAIDIRHPSGVPTPVAGSQPKAAYMFPPENPLAGKEIVETLHQLVELVEGVFDVFEVLSR